MDSKISALILACTVGTFVAAGCASEGRPSEGGSISPAQLSKIENALSGLMEQCKTLADRVDKIATKPELSGPPPAEEGVMSLEEALKNLAHPKPDVRQKAIGALHQMQRGPAAGNIPEILEAIKSSLKNPQVNAVLANLQKAGKESLALDLGLHVLQHATTSDCYGPRRVILGRVVVDGAENPRDVNAQMEILDEGYFASAVGDYFRPVGFGLHGYEPKSLDLKGKAGEIVDVGELPLVPVPRERQSRLKGKLVLDCGLSPILASVSLSMGLSQINTPHNGTSPRRSWPAGVRVRVAPTGEFEADGFSPARYYLNISAPQSDALQLTIEFSPGQTFDAGTVRVKCSDPSFYLGKARAGDSEIVWSTDLGDARARSKKEGKPLLVLITSAGCGPCKKLEESTLKDPWVQRCLRLFILLKAHDNKEVEGEYKTGAYPTVIFQDQEGNRVGIIQGYRTAMEFIKECLAVCKKLGLELPEELKAAVPSDRSDR